MRIFISALLALLIVSCGPVAPARSQSGSLVVTTCGTLPLAYLPGGTRPPTIDVNGRICTTTSGGGDATAANQALQLLINAPVAPATATATRSVLLGAQATTAAVNPTNGQQAALSSDTNNNLLVSPGGAPNLTITQVTVTTSDTSVAAARALRRSITVQNITGTQDVFCNQTTATAANGILLTGRGSSFTFSTTSAVRCIAITASQTVGVAETF